MYHENRPRHKARRPSQKLIWSLVFAGLTILVAVGVGIFVLLSRLSDQVLTIIATIGCAAGVSIPTLLVALVLLVKQAESGSRGVSPNTQPQAVIPPPLVFVPPMAFSPTHQQSREAILEQDPLPRRFITIGEP